MCNTITVPRMSWFIT